MKKTKLIGSFITVLLIVTVIIGAIVLASPEKEIKNVDTVKLQSINVAKVSKSLNAKDKLTVHKIQKEAVKINKAKSDSKKNKKTVVISKKNKKAKVVKKQVVTTKASNYKYIGTFRCTAYCGCGACCSGSGRTASGTVPTAGRTIATDPSVIPLGSKVRIDGHVYTAEDTGGAVRGNVIDVFFGSHSEALQWGVRYLEVYMEK